MKQHRYVVRDKLEYYDVFLSFGASLQPPQQQQQQQQSSVVDSGQESKELEIITVNGTTFEFCIKNLYRDTKIICNERVEYLMERYHISKSEAMISLLKGKDCTCSLNNGGGGGGDILEAKPSHSHSLVRITGDHIDTFLTMSSELDAMQINGRHQHIIIPGFLSVDAATVVVPAAATTTEVKSINNISASQQFHVDALPCCEDIMSKDSSIELTVETKGVTINTDEWQMMKVATDSIDDDDGKDDTTNSPAWIAVERKRSDATTTMPTFKEFYEDGWILTKDQILRLDYGINRGKFLPPFISDNNNDAIHNVSIRRRRGLASPLFESRENGGFDLRRAISLDPNRLSRQLIHPVVHPVLSPTTTNTSTSSLMVSNESLEVKEMLRQFQTLLKRNNTGSR
ncbi:hypothetical protein ACHAXM_006739 [Skeletonema potamos]